MKEYIQTIALLIVLITLITGPAFTYVIWQAKDQAKKFHAELDDIKNELGTAKKNLDASHHREFKIRIRLDRIIQFIKSFRASVIDVLEDSYNDKKPITEVQLNKFKNATDIDDILKEHGHDV